MGYPPELLEDLPGSCGVRMTKISVTIDEWVARAARESAERRGIGLAAWMREAVRNELAIPLLRLDERDGRLFAVADREMPTLTADMVRDTLEEIRR